MTWWMAAWLVVGASFAAWRWHVEDDEAKWAEVGEALRMLFEVHRPAALGLGVVSALVLLMQFVVTVVGWPGALAGLLIHRYRTRRR